MLKKIIVKLNIIKILSIPLYVCRIFPIKKNKIMCVNFSGKGYGDSPKYIVEELNHEYPNKFEIVWAVKNNSEKSLPASIKQVKINSVKYFFELATSKFWINNSRFPQYIVKRKKQIYIQTWHGGLALKKIEYDAEDKLSEYYKKVMKNDNKIIDYMISNSNFCTEMYKRGFRYTGKILEVGTPRNDKLINKKEELSSKAKQYLNLNKRILLYAPTFRNSYEMNPYDIDFAKVKEILEKKTNEEWEIVIKLHPRINNPEELIDNIDDFIDLTKYSDIQELICASDLMITDYSSTMFEAMIADKNVILYANDIDSYEDERGMYFHFCDLPFTLTQNNEELINELNKIDFESHSKKYNEFKKKVQLKEFGNASREVIKLIINNI